MSKRPIPAGTLEINGVAHAWGVSKKTAERRIKELNIKPIPSIRKKPVIWLEAKILAYGSGAPARDRKPARLVSARKLSQLSRQARAGKGGAK